MSNHIVGFDVDGNSHEIRILGDNLTGTYSAGDYGPKCGLRRILDLAAKYGVKFTFFVPTWIAEQFPERIKQIHDEGHDLAGHGYQHEGAKGLTDEQAIEIFKKSQKIIKDLTGATMRGWRPCGAGFSEKVFQAWYDLGWRYAYRDWKGFYPYRATVGGKEVDICAIPFGSIMDDFQYFWGGIHSWLGRGPFGDQYIALGSPNDALEYWIPEFESIHEIGGLFALTAHCRSSGRPANVRVLEKVLRHAQQTPGVWIAPVSEIADWVLRK